MTLSDLQGHAPIAPFQMPFFIQLCSSGPDYSWYSMSRGHSV